jgi:hypothetical protein
VADACSNCGTDLPEDASFCPECGTAAPSSVAPILSPHPWPSTPGPYPPTPINVPPPYGYRAAPEVARAEDTPPAASPRNTVAGVLAVGGALVLGVSSFLAWAEVRVGLVGVSQTVSGWDWFDNSVASGPLLAVLALVAAGLGGLMLAQLAPAVVRIVVIAVGALSLGLAAFAVSDILGHKGEVTTLASVDVDLQIGIWLTVAGALVVLASGFLATDVRPVEPPI